tara:strand:+ start:2177 stop:2674 length:498 start_codon:yes stop_codon:yes gene_type:complete
MSGIVILSATKGKNWAIAELFAKEVRASGQEATLIDLTELNLPLYTNESDLAGLDHPAFESMNQKMIDAKGLIVCAPEYNGSIPPTLVNFVAWMSTRSKNFRAHYNGKPVALASHSGGGGHNLMTSMRIMFSHLGANVLGRVLVVNKDKPLNSETLKVLVQGVIA